MGDERTVCIVDAGSSTFDCSILKIEDGIFEVVATSGELLGGSDFEGERAQTQHCNKLGELRASHHDTMILLSDVFVANMIGHVKLCSRFVYVNRRGVSKMWVYVMCLCTSGVGWLDE